MRVVYSAADDAAGFCAIQKKPRIESAGRGVVEVDGIQARLDAGKCIVGDGRYFFSVSAAFKRTTELSILPPSQLSTLSSPKMRASDFIPLVPM